MTYWDMLFPILEFVAIALIVVMIILSGLGLIMGFVGAFAEELPSHKRQSVLLALAGLVALLLTIPLYQWTYQQFFPAETVQVSPNSGPSTPEEAYSQCMMDGYFYYTWVGPGGETVFVCSDEEMSDLQLGS